MSILFFAGGNNHSSTIFISKIISFMDGLVSTGRDSNDVTATTYITLHATLWVSYRIV